MDKGEKLAIIRVRGEVRVKKDIKDTLHMLRLHRKNCCVVVPLTESYLGMAKKAKDYATYGEIDEETLKLLVEKRGKESKEEGAKLFLFGDRKYKPFFRLNPPRKGFGRKGIKMPFNKGGALGYRGDKINELIRRMV